MMKLNDIVREAQTKADSDSDSNYTKGVDRLDGFLNELSGLNTTWDRAYHTGYQLNPGSLDTTIIGDLIRRNDLARKMVMFRPKEATRQGFVVKAEDVDDNAIQRYLDNRKAILKLRSCMVWARAYGGSILVVGARDGLDPVEPLNTRDIQTIDWLKDIDRTRVTKEGVIRDMKSSWYGQPEYYIVQSGAERTRVHPSRVIEFEGVLTPETVKAQNKGWDDGVLEAAYSVLADFGLGFGAVSTMLSEANQSVISIDGLIDMLAEEEHDRIEKRLRILNLTRSVARALFLDAQAEKYENHELSFAGVAMILEKLMMRLSAAVEIPVTILMGRSPAGENATGEADFRQFYDTVRTEQKEYLEPRLNQLLRIVFSAKDGPTKGNMPSSWEIDFNSLWQETQKEKADRELIQAQRDSLYIDRSVVTPEQVALGRFSETTAIAIDTDRIQKQLAEAEASEAPKTVFAPTDVAKFVNVNEARRAMGQGDWPDKNEATLSVAAFDELQKAKVQALIRKLYGTENDD
jgi:phage-related protein (TIGR01555 family)